MKTIDVSKLTQEQLDAHFVVSVKKNDGLAGFWLDAGANVNGILDWNESALIYAIKNDNVELAEMLIEAGIDVNGTDRFNEPLLFYVLDDVKWLNILAKGDLNVNARTNYVEDNTALLRAYYDKNEEVFDRLIELGIDIDALSTSGVPILIISISNGGIWLDKLIKSNANVNIRDRDGIPAFFFAIYYNEVDVLNKLIEAKVDLNLTIPHDEVTGLMITTKYEIASILIKNGANINARDAFGKTALIRHVHNYVNKFAYHEESRKIIGLLLESGADANVVPYDGKTALKLARKSKDKELINLIRKYTSE